jgi:hypothetical protein
VFDRGREESRQSQGDHIARGAHPEAAVQVEGGCDKGQGFGGAVEVGQLRGNDAAVKPFAEGSNLKLAEACKRFLLHSGKDQDVRKWAAEGSNYIDFFHFAFVTKLLQHTKKSVNS